MQQQLREGFCGDRCVLGRLPHHGVPGDERRHDVPARHGHGKFPAVTMAATPTGVRNVNSCLSTISLGTVCP